MKYLVVGLGNIGPEYENTRHNIGFRVVDQLQKKINASSFEISRHAFVSQGKYKGREIHLIKPTTYMNLSGKAVRHWMSALKIPLENVIIVLDDLALPIGRLRVRTKGSDAGHNGLKNIREILCTDEYSRLRFGIGSNFSKGKQVDFVLGTFTEEEEIILSTKIDVAVEGILTFCTLGAVKCMNELNTLKD